MISEIKEYNIKGRKLDAFQYTREFYDKYFGTENQPTFLMMGPGGAIVFTPKGRLSAEIDDWLVKFTDGMWYPCKKETFEELIK
jgi:hypothetical protein